MNVIASDIELRYLKEAKLSGRTLVFPYDIALKVVADCTTKQVKVLGVDGLYLSEDTAQPDTKHSIDLSNEGEVANLKAIEFILNRQNEGLYFELILDAPQLIKGQCFK